MGGVVYEDPWFAGGHCGFSNTDEVSKPQSPYEKVIDLRKVMNANGLNHLPIIIAGGVWSLADWQDYIDNPEVGEVGFQFGTRPLLTQESPISDAWKKLLKSLKKEDIVVGIPLTSQVHGEPCKCCCNNRNDCKPSEGID